MDGPVRWEQQQGTKPPRSSWKLSPILVDESISNTSVVWVKGQPADQRLEGLEGLGACEFGVSGCVVSREMWFLKGFSVSLIPPSLCVQAKEDPGCNCRSHWGHR